MKCTPAAPGERRSKSIFSALPLVSAASITPLSSFTCTLPSLLTILSEKSQDASNFALPLCFSFHGSCPNGFFRVIGQLAILQETRLSAPLFREYTQKAEPQIARDVDDTRPHPTHLDQVFTAIYDALQLILIVLEKIDDDKDIFPHYFDPRRDTREKVTEVFQRLAGYCSTGNAELAKVTIQITDDENACQAYKGSLPEAYSIYPDTNSPKIVLCPVAFHKKAFTILNGVPGNPETLPEYYNRCQEVAGLNGGRVSYRMTTLGAILLHEYMHLDFLLENIYGKPIVDEVGTQGHALYGPNAVYDSPDIKLLARTNADSYTFYALNVFWDEICQYEFSAPGDGDSNDPDLSTAPTKRAVLNGTMTGGWEGRGELKEFSLVGRQ